MSLDYVVEEDEELYEDETDKERAARIESERVLDPTSQVFVDSLVAKILTFVDTLSGHPLRPYQKPFAARVIESLIIEDGETITALFSRQSGKTETIANVVVGCMILFPRLALSYPDLLGKFKEGMKVGTFAPVEEQANTLFDRIKSVLTNETTQSVLADPEIDDKLMLRAKYIELRSCRSFVRMQTANPKANIESKTYHLIVIDEAQASDDRVVKKSIEPMGSSTLATFVLTGTPTIYKGHFYETIQYNKRRQLKPRQRQNHFEADWKTVAKYDWRYKKAVNKTLLKIGEDSDEFQLSFCLKWLLDQGMFLSSSQIDALGDPTMEIAHAYNLSPVVAGIDLARVKDSTVVTVVWVDWAHPDEYGFYNHRILNWLELHGDDWELQFYKIKEFLSNYDVFAIGVDAQGLGDIAVSRFRRDFPGIDVVEFPSTRPEQSRRWKYLLQLVQRGKISWPGHYKTRKLKTWRRFEQQMKDLEKLEAGPYLMAAAPRAANAHDDYPDSLSLACVVTEALTMPTIEQATNPFF